MLKCVCSNEGCTEKALRCDLPKHRQECPHEIVLCKYAYRGCDVTLPREEMTEHQKDNQSHAHLSMLQHKQEYCRVSNFNWRKERNQGEHEIFLMELNFLLDLNKSSGKNTYISIELKDHPTSLPPWTSVTFELLNQLEDKNHHCCRLQLGARNDKFIAHSVLGYNPTTNCQYLKDNKLYFRLSINHY